MTRKFMLPLLLLAASCGNPHSFKKADDAQDAGREFIRASLDGDYEKASFFLYKDTTNQMLLAKWKQDFERLDHEERKKYKDADIMPVNITALNDSVTSYTYANSYKKDTTTIRVIRVSGEWQVDLKEILNTKH